MQTTTKLGLNKPDVSDYFNIDHFNQNAEKIDALTHMTYLTKTAEVYRVGTDNVQTGTITWYIHVFDEDGLTKGFEAYATHTINNLTCEFNRNYVYISNLFKVNLPSKISINGKLYTPSTILGEDVSISSADHEVISTMLRTSPAQEWGCIILCAVSHTEELSEHTKVIHYHVRGILRTDN